VTFEGTVTNNSGGDLNASDFFFDFFQFRSQFSDSNSGFRYRDRLLDSNGTTSQHWSPLFDVTFGLPCLPVHSFPIDVVLQDINSDSSAMQTVTVSVPVAAGRTPPESGDVTP